MKNQSAKMAGAAAPDNSGALAHNSFVRTLGELRRGLAVTEASNDLAKVVKEVQRTGRPGELVVVLKIRPSGEGVTVEDDIKPKVPKMAKKPTSFFTTEDGGLTRNNPEQPEMFKTVDGGSEIATMPNAGAEPEPMAANG